LTILEPFSTKGPQKYQKSIRFSLKVYDASRLRKTSKTFSKTRFWSFHKSCSKYLI